jgi:hypothetical protein
MNLRAGRDNQVIASGKSGKLKIFIVPINIMEVNHWRIRKPKNSLYGQRDFGDQLVL